MREIKFRGYNIKNKKWLYGCFLINRGKYFICPDGIQNPLATWEDFVVEPDSVGQFTGFKDSKGNEIYEGDLVQWTDNLPFDENEVTVTGVVEYHRSSFRAMDYFPTLNEDLGFHLPCDVFLFAGIADSRVIGNTWNNPAINPEKEVEK